MLYHKFKMLHTPESLPAPKQLHNMLDRAATGAALLCLVHCLLLPLALAALPTLGTALAVPESFHLGMVLFALPTSLWALASGFAVNRSRVILPLGLAGLALLLLGLCLPAPHETVASVAGSLLLCAAHVGNWRQRHGAALKRVASAAVEE